MENKEQDHTKKQDSTDHPKPSDEVQLTIETVTPDTAKTIPETIVHDEALEQKADQANQNDEAPTAADNEQAQPVQNASKDEDLKGDMTKSKDKSAVEDQDEQVESMDNDESEDGEANTTTDGNDHELETEEEKGDEDETEKKDTDNKESKDANQAGDDERDKIETIAP